MITVIDVTGKELKTKVWKFPAGEVGVKVLSSISLDQYTIKVTEDYGSDSVMAAIMLREAIQSKAQHKVSFTIYMPYLPYSRQDRRCHEGEAEAKVIFQSILKNYFDRIITEDVHSDQGSSNRLINIKLDPFDVLDRFPKTEAILLPDAGAMKKYRESLGKLGIPVYSATKTRTEKGIEVNLPPFGILPKNITVVDDICDGGATFIALAENMPSNGRLNLYVSHGIFSKGMSELNKYYDEIYFVNKVKSYV